MAVFAANDAGIPALAGAWGSGTAIWH